MCLGSVSYDNGGACVSGHDARNGSASMFAGEDGSGNALSCGILLWAHI